MTDARGIIARFFAEYHDRSRVDGCDMEDAKAIIERLDVAGYRILGPDEVDPVTLEKCAEVAAGFADQTDYDLEPEAAVAESVTANGIATAIRAIGRKA